MGQKYSGSEWLKSEVKELSPLGIEVADILGQVFLGIYHIDHTVLRRNVDWGNKYFISLVLDKSLATFDFNELTCLVVLCHDRMIRLSIDGAKKGCITLLFHQRKGRAGRMSERMPFLEEQIKNIREEIGLPIVEEESPHPPFSKGGKE